ncbi:hypothetical protein J7U46_22500 [Pelomonas sp. V22]|uniref:hypothetical protein n=1 Tax=Pelomonas sp. V22 TaxID=2822139 RepID=UPI0024A9B20C|nr:hypothetical protein [Pelomonas sp. V22]MDI4635854.1 hypothetical protein [Pelomonas sp. V22]
MTEKHPTAEAYKKEKTLACETALVLLLEAFGTLKPTLRLIGGLVPRYLAPEAPPDVPEHIGTTDVDVVLDVAVLAAGEDYSSLRDQLKKAGFRRHTPNGKPPSSWQWACDVLGERIVVEFLINTDDPNEKGLVPLDGEDISACRIPHAGLASDWYLEQELRIKRPDGDGTTIETVRHADAVAFIALKALALEYRYERKDVADLVHVLRYYKGAPDSIAAEFAERLATGKHETPLRKALQVLEAKFCDDDFTPGHEKDGPGRYAAFHGIEDPEERALELRNVSGLVTEFLRQVNKQSS